MQGSDLCSPAPWGPPLAQGLQAAMGNSVGLVVGEAEGQRCGLQGNWGGSEGAPLAIFSSTSYFSPFISAPLSLPQPRQEMGALPGA